MDNALSIGIRDTDLLIVAEGEIRAGECFALNDILPRYLDTVDAPKTIHIDLSRCTYMDSTFIGFIVGLTRKCGQGAAGAIIIANPSPQAKSGLKILSAMDQIRVRENIDLPDIPTFRLARNTASFSSLKNVEVVFEAHRTLSKLSEENRKEFSDLLAELSRIIDYKKGEPHEG